MTEETSKSSSSMNGFMKFLSASFLTQLFGRLLSFTANQVLVKLLIPAHFGIWSVRLALVLETITFWAREGVRKAATRCKEARYKYALLPLLIGIIATPVVVGFVIKSQPEGVDGYSVAVLLTGVGSLLELVSEMWAVPQLAIMNGGALAKITSFAFLVRSLTVVTLVKQFYDSASSTYKLMLCYGVANCVYGFVLTFGFLIKCGKPIVETPGKREFLSLQPFAFQTILQWLFAQGERMVLLMSNSPEQVGVYGFVSDISSLLARIVFAPIEASVFSLCATNKEPPIHIVAMAARFVVYIGLCAAGFGPPIAPKLLEIMYGEKWSGHDAQSTLTAVCRVMPIMTLNGVTEAFANARLPPRQLDLYNILLAIVSVTYFGFMYYLSRIYGACGAVYANGINMCLRSTMAIYVIFSECGRVWSLFPHPIPSVVLLALAIEGRHISIKISIGLVPVVGLLIAYAERKSITKVFSTFIKKE